MSDFVLPGEPITTEQGYLRGHGSYIKKSEIDNNSSILVASIAGRIDRINKLISVKAIKSRYAGEVGDLIVGRITTVDSKRWKVNICSQKDAILQLSSINLPGGVQRMRTYEDQLSMRTLFVENDLICAEVQNINSDGIISLHSRSLKYGKLENGQMVSVPSVLIKRLPQHYISLPFGIDIILGRNGFIWITRSIPDDWKANDVDILDDITPLAETLQRIRMKHNATPLTLEERLKVARTRNSVLVLQKIFCILSPDIIVSVYNKSIYLNITPKEMLQNSNLDSLTSHITR